MREYRIKDWDKHFENAASRKLDSLNWVPVPNKHDGEGFRTIITEKDGIIMYGCWHLILQVASKCQPRGSLVRSDGSPHTAKSISIKTGYNNIEAIQRTLDFCSSTEVGWLQCVINETPTDYQPTTNRLVVVQARREGNGIEGMEQKEGKEEQGSPSAASYDLDTLPGMVLSIRHCRPELAKVSDMSITNILQSVPQDVRRKMCQEFIDSVANMVECPKDPIGLLRGYARNAAKRSSDPFEGLSQKEKSEKLARQIRGLE